MASRSRHRESNPSPTAIPKQSVLQESVLIAIPLTLALHQLSQLQLPHRTIPFYPALILLLLLLSVTTIRHALHRTLYFKLPFTDQRGYRPSNQADDGLSIAVGLPFLVCTALFISSTKNQSATHFRPSSPTHLMEIWNSSPHYIHSPHRLKFSNSDYLLSLSSARLDLLSFTILNLYSLLLDLTLSILATSLLGYLPNSNSTRLIGSTLKSLFISIIFALAVKFELWGAAISRSMTPFECLFSIFTFQSSLYLTTRLARRAFTLAESSIFSSTGVSLMIEVIRLTSARLRYSSYLLKQQLLSPDQILNQQPISDQHRLSFLPSLFRFPTPAIAIQHVLVSGIFLMAFTLAPLLVLSRRLGQRPTKRSKPLSRSASNRVRSRSPARHNTQKPVWTSEPTQLDYYSRFTNPDFQHQSRQYESVLKENMRKIIALLIYASISWIGLVVMSHWLGWLFEIGRNKNPVTHQSWSRKILGPGWMAFFCYIFLDHHPLSLNTNTHDHRHEYEAFSDHQQKISIRWTRVGMLAYWCICLVVGIGGWTTYLVRKRRSIRDRNLDNPDLNELINDDSWSSSTNWKSRVFNLRHRDGSRSRSKDNGPISPNSDQILLAFTRRFEYNNPTEPSHLPESCHQTKHLRSHSLNPSTISNRPTTPIQSKTQTNDTLTPWYSHLLGHPQNSRPLALIRQLYGYFGGSCCEQKPESVVGRSGVGMETMDLKEHEEDTNEASGLIRSSSNSYKKKPLKKLPLLQSLSPTHLLASTTPTSDNKKEKLNFKRKFFHILACLMFIPTIPLDIEFSSISFSIAFVIFTFCEFARYFAFYPIGAGIHLFFNEFIDSKDSGPVILSHFYLLTACSTGIWLDGLGPSGAKTVSLLPWGDALPSEAVVPPCTVPHAANLPGYAAKIHDLVGLLILGFGDTFASVVGCRLGHLKWTTRSSKTVEGSLAFILSVLLVSLVLVATGTVEGFSFAKYVLCLGLVSLLEAFTNQNDNLILPLYSWSILTLVL